MINGKNKKTLNPAWDSAYKAGWGRKYPSENLIRFLCRYKAKTKNFTKMNKILDLGCGNGANTKMMFEEGFKVYGVDGSINAIKSAKNFLINEKIDLKVSDFSDIDKAYDKLFFDIICDDVSIYANRINDIKNILKKASFILKKDGLLYSSCFSIKTSGYGLGRTIENNTFANIPSGNFKNKGIAHFFTEKEVREIYGKYYKINSIDVCRYTEFNKKNVIDMLYIICRKK